jgi:hypothetical protein
VQSCSRQIWPLQEGAAEWRGGDKDKIAGSGFNKARRLADEESGERRKKSSEEIYKAATRSISDGESFLALQEKLRHLINRETRSL